MSRLNSRLLMGLLASTSLTSVAANPLLSDLGSVNMVELFGRGACTPCGYYATICCSAGSACYTDANDWASCSSTAAWTSVATLAGSNGYWNVYTTTYTQSELVVVTSVVSSWCATTAPATVYATPTSTWAPAATPSCDYSINQSPCGSICCNSGSYCVSAGVCSSAAAGSSAYYSSNYASTAAGSQTGFSAPLRPTSSTLLVLTSTASPTTTEPFIAPVATGANITLIPTEAQHSGGLSGGAIAGIVIGVLVGLALLILFCLCFCLKEAFDGILAIFGLGKKRRARETEYIEEYHHHTSRNGRSDNRSWYGSRPSRPERREKRGGGGLWEILGLAGCLAGLWAILGFKRSRDRRREEEKYSDYSSSYGSYYTSESSASSDDRRTRDTRRSSRR